MKIEEDEAYTTNILERLKKIYSFSRKEIHVSDIVYCLRKAYYRRINGSTVTDDQVLHFVRGQSLHALLEMLYPQHEVIVMFEGFFGTMDAYDSEKDAVVELKTVQNMYGEEPYEHHLQQLKYYMTMTKKNLGFLVYLILGQKKMVTYRIELTDKDLEEIQKEIISRKNLLNLALETRNPEILPYVDDWQCKYCEFFDICKGAKKEKQKEEEEK